MSRVPDVLRSGREAGRPLVIPFVTAGFPGLGSTVSVVTALARAGADMVEIGIPFSDPLADGPTIQRASERAIANGVTPASILEMVADLRAGEVAAGIPILLMGYCNPILRYGLDSFVGDAGEAGVDGLIVPDLPPDEATEYREACHRHQLSAVFLMAPNAPDERIRLVDEASTDFSYCVSVTGVTGARGQVQERTTAFLERVGRIATKPFVVGFGIKEPEHVRAVGNRAAGVVIGSALIDEMEDADDPARAAAGRLSTLVRAAREVAEAGDEEIDSRTDPPSPEGVEEEAG